mmetsp:Transcript_31612/g.69251  ORF Transcript_31612/g.69251 Transcript_31612/m.69251 type:complete len:599 (+) Transcript_31612:47-1843(+)
MAVLLEKLGGPDGIERLSIEVHRREMKHPALKQFFLRNPAKLMTIAVAFARVAVEMLGGPKARDSIDDLEDLHGFMNIADYHYDQMIHTFSEVFQAHSFSDDLWADFLVSVLEPGRRFITGGFKERLQRATAHGLHSLASKVTEDWQDLAKDVERSAFRLPILTDRFPKAAFGQRTAELGQGLRRACMDRDGSGLLGFLAGVDDEGFDRFSGLVITCLSIHGVEDEELELVNARIEESRWTARGLAQVAEPVAEPSPAELQAAALAEDIGRILPQLTEMVAKAGGGDDVWQTLRQAVEIQLQQGHMPPPPSSAAAPAAAQPVEEFEPWVERIVDKTLNLAYEDPRLKFLMEQLPKRARKNKARRMVQTLMSTANNEPSMEHSDVRAIHENLNFQRWHLDAFIQCMEAAVRSEISPHHTPADQLAVQRGQMCVDALRQYDMTLMEPGADRKQAAAVRHEQSLEDGCSGREGLFLRLGGVEGLETVTKSWVKQLTTDKRVAGYFAKVADVKRLRQVSNRISDYLIGFLDGPMAYQGPALEEIHARLDIGVDDYLFDSVWDNLRKALVVANADPEAMDDLLGLGEELRHKIVLTRLSKRRF